MTEKITYSYTDILAKFIYATHFAVKHEMFGDDVVSSKTEINKFDIFFFGCNKRNDKIPIFLFYVCSSLTLLNPQRNSLQ